MLSESVTAQATPGRRAVIGTDRRRDSDWQPDSECHWHWHPGSSCNLKWPGHTGTASASATDAGGSGIAAATGSLSLRVSSATLPVPVHRHHATGSVRDWHCQPEPECQYASGDSEAQAPHWHCPGQCAARASGLVALWHCGTSSSISTGTGTASGSGPARGIPVPRTGSPVPHRDRRHLL